jgi:nucleoside-diphosphate-sugar epimerase
VLVTGASGFIGRWVVRALIAEGATIAVVGRHPACLEPDVLARARAFPADLEHPGELASIIDQWRPSIAFNLAGYGIDRTERDEVVARHVNMHIVGEAIEALEDRIQDAWPGARFVQAGSALEYGSIQEPLDENAQPLPSTTYGQTKLAATTILQHARDEDRFPSVTARLFTVFGPGEHAGRLFPTLVGARATNERIPLSIGTQSRDFVYVEDAATALLKLGLVPAERLTGGMHPFDAPAINVASGNLTSVREFALAAAKILGIPESRLGFGDLPQLPEEMFHGPVPVARLQAALGWLPPADPASGLQRAAALATQ